MTESIINQDSAFLAQVRDALAPGAISPRTKEDHSFIFDTSSQRTVLERIESRNDLDYAGLVQLFSQNCPALNLQLHTATDFDESSKHIVDIVLQSEPEFSNVKHIVQHNHPDLRQLRLWEKLEGESVSVHTTFKEDQEIVDKTKASYIGITCADWGVAESATLIQLTSPDRPRSTSLVPSIHIGLLRRKNLLLSLEEAYCIISQQATPTSMTFISGPSKTADIEAHMVHGAHGPREMHVIVVG